MKAKRMTLSPDRILIQQKITDIAASVWVCASAGTGKTKTLTDRVLALLLKGTAPESILCLTYTNAAAGEMLCRVQERLMGWGQMSTDARSQELGMLLGREALPDEVIRAGRLVHQLIDKPHLLHITTIHGFCHQLLRQFPLEANIPLNAQMMDDGECRQLFCTALEAVLEEGAPETQGDMECLSHYLSDQQLPHLIQFYIEANAVRSFKDTAFLSSTDWIHQTADFFAQHWPVDQNADISKLKATVGDIAKTLGLSDSPEDREKALFLSDWHQDPEAPLEDLVPHFLTLNQTVRTRLCSAPFAKRFPETAASLKMVAEDVVQHVENAKAAAVAKATISLTRIAAATLSAARKLKENKQQLDYTDLLEKTVGLLSNATLSPWVRYKLDQKIHHVLVDEAQDTSPLQWHLIWLLTEEFFAQQPEGEAAPAKSLFVVGDGKQSIYSFQGAFAEAFGHFHEKFRALAHACGKPWWDVSLAASFRSTQPILDAVDAVFNGTQAQMGIIAVSDTEKTIHTSARQAPWGRVALFPLAPKDGDKSGPEIIAAAIAKRISTELCQKRDLPSYHRPVRPQDYLILVQQRGPLVNHLFAAFKREGIPVAPADRLALGEDLIIQDLLALAAWVMTPEDDLSLSIVLKSPLVGMDDEALQRLCLARGTQTLFTALHSHDPLFYDRLNQWLTRGREGNVRQFFASVTAESRMGILSRLGANALELVCVFLDLVSQMQEQEENQLGLHGFVERFERIRDLHIKRPLAARTPDQVRIQTIHGAKGLQAPIVILADAKRQPDVDQELVLDPTLNNSPLIWIPRAALRLTSLAEGHQHYTAQMMAESYRLLYVAMTRAEEELAVYGWQPHRQTHGYLSWYDCILRAVNPSLVHQATPNQASDEIVETDFSVPVFENIPPPPCGQASALHEAQATWKDLGDMNLLWYTEEPIERAPPLPPPPLDDKNAAEGKSSVQRGIFIHQLIQLLAPLDPDSRRTIGARWKESQFFPANISPHAMLDEVITLLSRPSLAHLWKNPQFEVPIAGKVQEQLVRGRIDLLTLSQEKAFIVDFKSGTRETTSVKLRQVYHHQLARYQEILAPTLAPRLIQAAILWTGSGELQDFTSLESSGTL